MPKMQLEDFNHAMLRTIYAFYLLLYTLGVFAGGVALLPLGYFAVLMVRARILRKLWKSGKKQEHFILQITARN